MLPSKHLAAMPTFKPDEHLMVELVDECFVGQLFYQNAGGTRLELINVRNWITNETFHSVQIFYYKDIRSVRRLVSSEAATSPAPSPAILRANVHLSQPLSNISKEEEEEANTPPPSTLPSTPSTSPPLTQSEQSPPSPPSSPSPSSSSATPSTPSPSLTCQLPISVLQRIRSAVATPAYYPHTDRRYYAAIAALQSQPIVALSVGFAYRALHSEVGLLTLTGGSLRSDVAAGGAADDDDESAAIGTVHIFDITSMGGRIPDALRQLLGAERPLKIMHDSTLAAYVLNTVYNIRLDGLFDTRVAHVAVGGQRQLISLGAMLEMYLRLPAAAVLPSEAAVAAVDWTERPLSAERRTLAGQLVAYLPALHSHLLYDCLLGDFLASCASFAHEYSRDDYDDVDVACRVSMHITVQPTGRDGDERSCDALKPTGLPKGTQPLLSRLEELAID